jgi:hypothetical protein
MEKHGSYWKEFHEIWWFFENLSIKFEFYWNLKRITGSLHEDLSTYMTTSRWILLRIRNISHKSCREIETHLLCKIIFSRKSCHLWDHVEKYGRAGQATDDNIMLRMRLECWISKAINTHSEYIVSYLLIFGGNNGYVNAPNVTLCVHCLPCWTLNLVVHTVTVRH